MHKTALSLAAACIIGAAPAAFAEGPHWSYGGHEGPQHWSELDGNFKTCKIGRHQSPINIPTAKVEKSADLKPIGFAYTASGGDIVNNGHTIQVNLAAGGTARIAGEDFKLVQFHFHTPSEELFDGKSYPLVAHLVHKNAKGELAVVAVLFQPGKENAALKPVFEDMPAKSGESYKLDANLDAASLLPADRTYYAFTGSLTTPPCSEEVRWQVLKTPVEISEAQLAQFHKLYQMNARPVQPLNDRKVQMSQS